MKTSNTLLLSALVAGATLIAPLSAQAKPDRSELTMQSEKVETLSGTISDVGSDELVIKGTDGSEQSVKIDEETAISVDGKKATASDLEKGQYVVASAQSKGGDLSATIVSARSTKSY